MRRVGWILFLFMVSAGYAAPVTRVQVSRPTTRTTVTRPTTSVAVSHPTTAVAVSHSTTTGTVSHPMTSVSVSHPTTAVSVSQPHTSAVGVTAPADKKGISGGKKQAATSAPAGGKKPSMMSSYQPPQATDFKAAKLGGGEGGMGNKVNEAEKDAAAASFNAPKGEDVSLQSVLKGGNSSLKANLQQKVEKQTGK